MDIRTLPEEERVRYNRLKEKFSIHFSKRTFGDHTIRLLQPSDLEELLDGKDPFEDVSTFPFWARLWESAVCLGRLLSSLPVSGEGRLLELGAGLGAPGLVAAVSGFKVTLSDYEPEILDFQRISAAANGLDTVETLLLDWKDPPETEFFDIIAGAEILFREEFVDPLLDICKNKLTKDGAVYLAHDVRRSCLPIFLRRAEKDFVIGSKKQVIIDSGRKVEILVNRLQFKR